eukprot:3660141-Pyramimonas_sp.AAC.1
MAKGGAEAAPRWAPGQMNALTDCVLRELIRDASKTCLAPLAAQEAPKKAQDVAQFAANRARSSGRSPNH